jgi:endonuclease/exonuclease/phosphatase family metal-dependent hydrolase
MIKLATFNLFWFPSSQTVARNERSVEDEALVARVVSRLDADAIAFQEILDPDALKRTLASVPNRRFELVHEDPDAGTGDMRVTIAFDTRTLELLRAKPILEPEVARQFHGRRAPLAALLLDRASGKKLWFIGAHLKSGLPSSNDPENDVKRRWECELLAKWLRDLPASGPGYAPAFLLGDFNLEADRPPLEALTAANSPAKLVPARVLNGLPERGAGSVSASDRWSTLLDGVIIDHAFTARGGESWLSGQAVVDAFDLDPEFAEPRTNGVAFFRVEQGSSYSLKPYWGAPYQEVRAMYRVSDHRPLRITLQPV